MENTELIENMKKGIFSQETCDKADEIMVEIGEKDFNTAPVSDTTSQSGPNCCE